MKTILLLVVGTAVALTQPVIAGAIHQLSITENSSTSLTATYDGSPLTVTVFGFPEAWTISLPPSFVPSTFLQQWSEPENSTLVNSVNFGSSLFFVLIKSDRQFTDTFALNGDGATVPVGTDRGATVFATFNDNAAGSEAAPDTGATIGLLFLALIALFGATHVSSRRSA
jgi:hypothetical protein